MIAKFSPVQGITFEVEASTQKEVFKAFASLAEVFSETACGACGSPNITFAVRTVEDNDYYEQQCKDCRARLAFGQSKNGKDLFPKRKLVDVDGEERFDYKQRGWAKWTPPAEGDAPEPKTAPAKGKARR